ncbi:MULTISPECIES: glycosyltransferase [Chryseobacterium]|jgi:glycosyltransferase involved in cell wall biosynthesis|uniref:Glycosyltransferase n=2 Tax=Chryseobacterium shandongense TaxID=1493872 RepID=A0ABM7B712_9FLAO|nr:MULTISPECIES: glycosyltransferase [Chryseobacterium]AZA94434.1 glycosyltransferase [Chryseobacterium shandongense]
MKILFFIDSLGSGGAQKQMVELAKGFLANNNEVQFLVYHPLDFYNAELTNAGIKITLISDESYLRRILKIRKFIRNNNFDVVISFLSGPVFISEISSLPFRRWKLIVGERSANPVMQIKMKWKIMRLFHSLADFVVCNSHLNANMVLRANPLLKNKCKTIYNIVDLEKYTTTPITDHEKFNLVIPSSHQYLKNLKGLIEGVALLPKPLQEKLDINWYGEVLDKSLEEGKLKIAEYGLDHIFTFHHPVKNIHEVMQKAGGVGLFSFYEGLPNAVCEAMACGKPVVASNISDNSILIGNDSLLCVPTDSTSISTALKNMLSLNKTELENIGKRNREFAENNFNSSIIIKQYSNLFDND